MIELHQIAAALYLAAGIGAWLGLALPAPRMGRGAVWGLSMALAVHSVAFFAIHRAEPPPPLTHLGAVVSLMAWLGGVFLTLFMWRQRLTGLVSVAGPVSFLACFFAALELGGDRAVPSLSGSWPHAHVLLGSAGLSLFGVAGIAGAFFLIEHRRLKKKRLGGASALPSLEALDRVNVIAISLGFPLLTLGVITGVLWVRGRGEAMFSGSPHETFTSVAWALYAGLVVARFLGHQGARQAAASALGGFAFLLFAVVGVRVLA